MLTAEIRSKVAQVWHADSGSVFPDEIEGDPWTMFHGTSHFNAESIERYGFTFSHDDDVVSRGQVQRVVAVFEKMKWAGENSAGSVLKPFSEDYDFRPGERSLLFFAEISFRALLYATRDFAGGEKLRALRYALRDLNSYLHDSQIREKHHSSMEASFRRLTYLNAFDLEHQEGRPLRIRVKQQRSKKV